MLPHLWVSEVCVVQSGSGGALPKDRHNNIAVLELYLIVLEVYLYFKTATDNCINIYTDKKALVPALNKLYSKDVTLKKLLRPLVAFP